MTMKFSCVGNPVCEPLTERHVQAVWYDYAMRPANLRTTQGARVRVVHPGEWNLGAGPDFKNAVVELASETGVRRLRGDVEVHLSPRDWEAHAHGRDPRYAGVIVHVTWFAGEAPPSLPENAISIVLGPRFAAEPAFSPEQIDLSAYPFDRLPSTERPCRHWLADSPSVVQTLLDEAGRFRLNLKANRIGLILSNHLCGRSQLFYEEVMAALGYKANSRNFCSVARSVPLDRLLAEPENAAAALQSAASFVAWERGATRPHNSPFARLSAAAALFTETDILSALEEADFSPIGCRIWVRRLVARRLMGAGRAAAVFANVIVPFALYEGRIRTPLDWLPPEDVSLPVRLTAFRLLGPGHDPAAVYAKDGLRIQGLVQIHREFCLPIHPNCGTCYLSREHGLPESANLCEYGT